LHATLIEPGGVSLSSDFSTGLMISVVGLSVTFFALALFIGVIFLLKVLFPYKEEKEEVAEAPALVETGAEEVAAAIAAVVYAKANQTGKPATGKNPMWTSQ
jgi:Na+-transporting methylmalonyl-CoA/oxaloacetate decarboxylase gamma subunit